jgi:cholesterol transport system auxiliary component
MTQEPHARDRRAFLAITVSALALSGCSDLLGPPPPPQIYVLRPEFAAPVTPTARVDWSLSIMRPSAAGTLDSDRIALIQPDAKMDYYANAQYPDALPGLVQTALLDGFEKNGALAGVARDSDALHADYDLFLDIKDFEARYAVADGVPEAVVTVTARLATAHGRAIAGSVTLSQNVPASANNVGAVTVALQQALTAVVSGIVTWTLSFPAPATQLPSH